MTDDVSTGGKGRFVQLGHVNNHQPDQAISKRFYIDALGLTRDPEMFTGTTNMAINIGESQFHLPTFAPQVLRGHVGLVMPSRERLLALLADAKSDLTDTMFAFEEHEDYVAVTGPWGSQLRCYEPAPRFGDVPLCMPYVQFDVERGTARAISRFYSELLGEQSEVGSDEDGEWATVALGPQKQEFIFRESDQPVPDYDGHHVQVYHSDLEGLRAKLKPKGLVYDEIDHQFRFKDIIDLDDDHVLFTIDHEVRGTTHPMYQRFQYNRPYA